MGVYPPEVADRFRSVSHAGEAGSRNAEGKAASFVCGAFIALSLRIDEDAGVVEEARWRTNGCGYMVAAGDVLSEWVSRRPLAELHGLNDDELLGAVSMALGSFPGERVQCAEVACDALREAMADYRRRRIDEFRGDSALICTCFGVSEDTLVSTIAAQNIATVDEVMATCRAGSGCGSCRMMIQELIDMRD